MSTSVIKQSLRAAAALLAMALPALALASGDWSDVSGQFREHIDDYRAEINEMIDEAEAIASARASGEDVGARLDAYVDLWESVKVHGAIETQATVTYPGIWQGIIGLQQAAEADAAPEVFQARLEDLKAALWQGFGAVRLAASGQTGASTEPAHDKTTPSEVVDAIVAELREAVSAYESGDTKRANELISSAYIERFEGLEGDLIEQDPDLVTDLEKDFNATLPMAMQRGEPVSEVRAELERMIADLETARQLLVQSAESRSEVF